MQDLGFDGLPKDKCEYLDVVEISSSENDKETDYSDKEPARYVPKSKTTISDENDSDFYEQGKSMVFFLVTSLFCNFFLVTSLYFIVTFIDVIVKSQVQFLQR